MSFVICRSLAILLTTSNSFRNLWKPSRAFKLNWLHYFKDFGHSSNSIGKRINEELGLILKVEEACLFIEPEV